MNDIQKWRTEMLAKFGGFSHKYIASKVFETPMSKVSKKQLGKVQYYLHKFKIKVTDWRNGISAQAKLHAAKVSKPKSRRKRKTRSRRNAA